ncbi:Acg family FMN-binding oxidoreductase [Spirilliplanes yamanashiensis]|uniref:NAD(P)H nitroreductase n=2 Tax=Spirilliplanes yamanashiensis TaxID=42233 RepID=A0A8J3YF37_9ACTN|nr:nitroreductase family protein [Spirilliplanes yamanashiensis]MDP9818317.1 nitroreductase [Spirilliplanes yamanashiensis]GIJ06774.1 NAD(P)H nitroreductase [Spirilliplanes yamanashiensis]
MTTRTGATAAALARAAALAGYAPSLHNTQPWRWTVLADRMELHAVRERQLPASDPDGRLLLVSCGTALHHARTALTATGWECTVQRLPRPRQPDLLAVLTPTAHHPPGAAAGRLVRDMETRRTDRRPVSDSPPPAAALTALAAAAGTHGVAFGLLTQEQVYDLAAAASRAADIERADPAVQDEIAYWTGRQDDLGVAERSLTGAQPETTVPVRDFGRPGTLPSGPGHDRAARYAVLSVEEDEPEAWLRAGEALSAVWLTATRHGVSVLPLSAVVEVPVTRAALRRSTGDRGWPVMVLRIGVPDAGAGAPAAPRLSAAQIVDVDEVRHLLDRD